MKFTGPKAKRCRRQGVNLYGSDKYDKILQRKPYGPGKDPKSRSGRQSQYGKQLQAKQLARDIYGLSERQFKRLYTEAVGSKAQTGDVLKQLLERRLDNVLYRAGLAHTRLQARQFAGHGLFQINGVRVTSPSYRLKEGDVISVRARSKSSPVFAEINESHQKYLPPEWLKVNTSDLTIEIVTLPAAEHAEQAVDVRQVIEFYSRN